jgi:hypothetical protein
VAGVITEIGDDLFPERDFAGTGAGADGGVPQLSGADIPPDAQVAERKG